MAVIQQCGLGLSSMQQDWLLYWTKNGSITRASLTDMVHTAMEWFGAVTVRY